MEAAMPSKIKHIPVAQLVRAIGDGVQSVRAVAQALEVTETTVARRLEAGGVWEKFRARGRSGPYKLQVPDDYNPQSAGTLSDALLERFRVRPAECLLELSDDEPDADAPMMEWAFFWASCGFEIFPAKSFIGSPELGEKGSWLTSASKAESNLVKWWSQHADADIATSPTEAGCFVVELAGSYSGTEFKTREEFEDTWGEVDPLLVTNNAYGDVRLWFSGTTFTRLNALGRGVHILGRGSYTFLPPSQSLGLI
jgi:Bifunctional DNA primase/polymerase, N-terminal